jgi:hypothetical protein
MCDFKEGFRAFFVFKIDPDLTSGFAHGFTFAITNGSLNTFNSIGGDYYMPELLAYGGDSRNQAGVWLDGVGYGLRPPKLAIEFDARQNTGSSVCSEDSRSDGGRDQMAYVFWGINTASCSPNKNNSPTYDDNKHGVGDASNPANSSANDTADTGVDYFTGISKTWVANWLKVSSVPAYAYRAEITRSLTPSGGPYDYTIKSWIKNCNDATCSEFNGTNFDNMKAAYGVAPQPSDAPILNRTIQLSQSNHDSFEKFLLGWTAATGGSTAEKVTIKNFKMYFLGK